MKRTDSVIFWQAKRRPGHRIEFRDGQERSLKLAVMKGRENLGNHVAAGGKGGKLKPGFR